MKFYLFSTDGWATQEYTKRTGDLPDNAHALPAGTQINLAFWNGSEVVEKTQAERDAYDAEQATIAEVARQEAKPLALKQAENDYFSLIDKINTDESANLLYSDNSAELMQKAEAAGLSMTKKGYYGMLLQNSINEVNLKGGSWYDLPTQPHNLEV